MVVDLRELTMSISLDTDMKIDRRDGLDMVEGCDDKPDKSIC